MAKRSGIILLLCAVLLIGLGITALTSTSFYLVPEKGGGEAYQNVWGQVRWLGIGVVALVVGAFTNYQRLHAWRWWLLGLTVLAMLACLLDATGREVNGARRWLNLPGGMGGQPSEFAKIALIVALAGWYARRPEATRRFLRGIVGPLAIVALVLAAFWYQRDLGNAVLAGGVALALMFTAGARLTHLLLVSMVGAALTVSAVMAIPNRMERVQAFFDSDPTGRGHQQTIAKLAFGSGGFFGRGLGEGRMKLAYLPEAHTDFIFPMVGEEMGFLGTSFTVLLFVLLICSGMCIAAYAPDRFGKLLGMGLTTLIACEALLNMAVTTELVPNKGLPLPFVSYGGSSLVAACLIVGILVNIHRQGVYLTRDQLPVIRRDRRWTPQL